MVGTMRAAHGRFVESLVCALSGGGLFGGQVLRLGRFFIGVIFVAELRNTVGRGDWQIDALAAPVSICKRAVEIFGIGWIGVAESIPAFPNPVQVGVMEIEQGVTADRGEIGHIASDCKMRQEMRVGVQLGIKAVAACTTRLLRFPTGTRSLETTPIWFPCSGLLAPHCIVARAGPGSTAANGSTYFTGTG